MFFCFFFVFFFLGTLFGGRVTGGLFNGLEAPGAYGASQRGGSLAWP